MLFLLILGLVSTTIGLPTPIIGGNHALAFRRSNGDATRAQFQFDPFRLTDLGIQCLKNTPDDTEFDCDIQFNWENPNANRSDSCRYSWKWDGVTKEHGDQNNYNIDYYQCIHEGPEFFQYYFQSMTDYSNFSLRLSHRFKDARHFQPPEYANMFAEGNFTLLQTQNIATSVIYMAQGPLEAPFKGLTI